MPMLTDEDRRDAEHIGDGVYVRFDGFQIWLFTSNGLTKSDPVALEPSVFARLSEYAHEKFVGSRSRA